MNWEAKILEHFTLGEARCHGWEGSIYHDCGLVILKPELIWALDCVRKLFDSPVIVNSWTRCKPHNIAIDGVSNSYHLNGSAVDIRPATGGNLAVLELLCRRAFPFVLAYETFLHCDIRGERP